MVFHFFVQELQFNSQFINKQLTYNHQQNVNHNHLSIVQKHMEKTVGIFAVTGTEREVKDKGNQIWGWRGFYMFSYTIV